jgi:hypothetical protein
LASRLASDSALHSPPAWARPSRTTRRSGRPLRRRWLSRRPVPASTTPKPKRLSAVWGWTRPSTLAARFPLGGFFLWRRGVSAAVPVCYTRRSFSANQGSRRSRGRHADPSRRQRCTARPVGSHNACVEASCPQPQPTRRPPIVRLRRLLKAALQQTGPALWFSGRFLSLQLAPLLNSFVRLP